MARSTITVVIPCYNGSAFLREALDSVLAQTHAPLEVIVVDDGSTDDSADVAEACGPPVRVIRQENQGESVARNRGIDEARGDWIALLDADDLWKPEKLERQLEAAKPDVVAVHTNWHVFGTREFVYDVSTIPEDRRYSVEQLCTSTNPFHISSLMVRRELPVRFPQWTSYGEDMVYYLELALAGRIMLVPEVLTAKRVHPGAQSAITDVYARWHKTLTEWLRRNEDRLDERTVRTARRGLLLKVTRTAWAAYWQRDWHRFRALRDYLRQYAGDPEVDRLLARRVWPRWMYAVKDGVDRLRGRSADNSPTEPPEMLPYVESLDDDV